MKVAIICLLALCLITLWVILWVICKIEDNELTTIVKCINNLAGYKHDDLYFKLAEIRDDTWKLVEMNKQDKNAEKEEAAEPDPPDALIVNCCPVCGCVPEMYKHTELNSYCVRCSKGLRPSAYDSRCTCSICVVSDNKIAAITTWNDAVNDYIMHKNEED